MTLREIKEWIDNLPEKFLDYSAVNGEYGTLDDEYYYRVDKPIVTLVVDEKTNEVLFLNDIQDENDFFK